MTGGRPLPMVLNIDVEPDTAAPRRGAREPWRGFEAWLEYSRGLRDRLAEATASNVSFNWYLRMDHQIAEACGEAAWVADAYAHELAELSAAGDLVGLHPHAWKWREVQSDWIQDHGDEAWVEHVVETSFEAYRRAFGVACRAHRFGSRFVSPALVRSLRARGVDVDLTVEPGSLPAGSLDPGFAHTGSVPDQQHAPRHAYRPAAHDPLVEATGDVEPGVGLWMLPHTAFDPGPLLPAWRRLARRVRFVGRPLHRQAQLWAPIDARGFWRLADASVATHARPYISLAVRSDALIRPALGPNVTAKLEALMADPLVSHLRFMTATAALDELTGVR